MPVDRRPSALGGALSLALGAASVALVAGAWSQTQPLAVVLGGLAAVLLGGEAFRREFRVTGVVLGSAGLFVAVAGIGLGAVLPTTAAARAELLPGLVGLVALAFGSLAVPRRLARPLLLVGAGLVFVGVLVSGVVRGADLLPLLGATVCAVAAWDVAEQGLSLAEQVGRRAVTLRVRALNGGVSLAVGGVGIGLAMLLHETGPTDLSLSGVVLLLGAALVLALALYE